MRTMMLSEHISSRYASTKEFGVPRECAVAAFKGCKKTEMTVAEAKQIIDRFMKKEVK